jgi:hypothetical protein
MRTVHRRRTEPETPWTSLVIGWNLPTIRSSMRPMKRTGSARIQCTAGGAERPVVRYLGAGGEPGKPCDGLASLGEVVVRGGQRGAATRVEGDEGPEVGIVAHRPRPRYLTRSDS